MNKFNWFTRNINLKTAQFNVFLCSSIVKIIDVFIISKISAYYLLIINRKFCNKKSWFWPLRKRLFLYGLGTKLDGIDFLSEFFYFHYYCESKELNTYILKNSNMYIKAKLRYMLKFNTKNQVSLFAEVTVLSRSFLWDCGQFFYNKSIRIWKDPLLYFQSGYTQLII